MLVDVHVPAESTPDEQLSRWHLFASAAEQLHGEFHVVVPARIEGMAGRSWARQLSEATGIEALKVWEVEESGLSPTASRRGS